MSTKNSRSNKPFSPISGTGISAAPMITKLMDFLRYEFKKTLVKNFLHVDYLKY